MSMSGHSKRLGALETAKGYRQQWTLDDEGAFAWMTGPPLLTIIREYASKIAQRRWLHTHGKIAGRPMTEDGRGWYVTTGYGWHSHTGERERLEFTQAELDHLGELMGDSPFHQALQIWTNAPDENGWPSLQGSPDGYAEFTGRVQREREMLAVHRSNAGRYGIEWRRRYPEWSPNMTAAEYDDWELRLLKRGE